MTGAADLDTLLARLRERAQDPKRRADVIVDAFSASARTLDLGSLLGAAYQASAQLHRVVREIQGSGKPSDESRTAADAVAALMARPAQVDLPPTADPASVDDLEHEAGGRLPEVVRRAWLEIADGGFGPGAGLLSSGEARQTYHAFREASPGPRGSAWPAGMIPIVDRDPGYECVDVSTGRIVDWNPEDLRERSSDATWRRSFREVADVASDWLAAWVDSRTVAELAADQMKDVQVQEARRARAMLREKGPAYRASMGLPEEGWERVVWGGIGLDDDVSEAT